MTNSSRPRRATTALLLAAVCAVASPSAPAADVPPELVGRFTRQVQPLLLNRCAAGACHGGPRGHAPLFRRDPATSTDTLANAEVFLGLLGPDGDPRPLMQRLAVRHPAATKSRGLVMQPLASRERAVLEAWLVDGGRATGRHTIRDPYVAPVSHEQPVAAVRPNRFRALLEAAANPPDLPPPQEPQGILLGKDELGKDEREINAEEPASGAR